MFSGIIKEKLKSFSSIKKGNSLELSFLIPKGWDIEEGESINIDGVCSTVAGLNVKEFKIFYMPETLDKTTLGDISSDHVYNLERCLTLNDLISGHLVYGHVDTTAKVTEIIDEEKSKRIKFEIDRKFNKYIVYKGSISINGVSLTVISVDENSFSVSLIPYTLDHTNLGELSVGDKVNIEVDMMAKHIEKLLESRDSN